jgi:DNA-binding response OmpR family regulator
MSESQNKKILIVDDTIENLQVAMNFIIEDAVPYAILAAQNGKIALDIAARELPDIIIMDWEMPEMNGIETIKELKKNSSTEHIPVIISTGIRLSNHDLKVAFDAGASDFMRKPIEKTEFVSRINSHLKQAEYISKIKQQSLIIEESDKLRLENNIKALESGIEENISIISYYDKLLSELTIQMDELIKVENINNDSIKNICSSIEHARKTVLNTNLTTKIPDTAFIKALLKTHKNLTPQEIQLSFMVKNNMPSKEIANLTFREITSVKVARSRLRKKLDLNETDNLTAYLNNF